MATRTLHAMGQGPSTSLQQRVADASDAAEDAQFIFWETVVQWASAGLPSGRMWKWVRLAAHTSSPLPAVVQHITHTNPLAGHDHCARARDGPDFRP